MSEQTDKKYSIKPKPQDFIPFVGSLSYQNRNWNEADEERRRPEPYSTYLRTVIGLTLLNFATGVAILEGLESLIK